MATWDGSYSGPDDQNYYMYPDHTIPGPATGNWTYFPSNTNDDYSRSNRQFCVQNEPALEQNSANSFPQLNSNIVPSLVSETNNYPEHLADTVDKTQELSTHERFMNSAKPEKYWNHNHDLRSAKAKRNSSKKGVTDATQSTINQSKLRVMAEDFVPHNIDVVDVKYESLNVEPASNTNRCVRDHSESSDKYFFNNTSKYERKYNNKKGYNHRPREGQQDQFYKGNSYGKSYQHQGRTSNRCQGNKYFANRYYADKSQVDSANMNRNLLGTSVTNAAACNSKYDAVINTNNGESSLNAEANSNKNKHLWDEDNREETIVVDTDNIKDDAQDCNNQAKEQGSYNPDFRQSYSNYRNVKKYPPKARSNREENFYKEMRRNHQGYNRENYNKEIKPNVKDHDSSNGECSEFKQGSSTEISLETRGKKEKRYKNYGYKGLKDNSKETKTEGYIEKEKNKYYMHESKEKVYEQWRSKRNGNERSIIQRWGQNKKSAVDDDANQRERLVDQLNRGHLECLVCCEYIKQSDYIWSCCNCYHVLHLKCVKKWAKSSQAENGWRCPACQNVSLIIPEDYFCFCGKTRVPEWNRQDAAHSCGEICGRMLSKNTCPHKCTLLCHPGSCPQCTAMVTKHCGCGKTSQTVQCSMHKLLLCDSVCSKGLNCGSHKCEGKCHHGECLNCDKTITQACYCGKHTREVTCEANIPIVYSCNAVCGKLLECGNHTCKKLCHADACEPCSLTPQNITTCCCGQTALTEKRETCLDPVPTCDKVCLKNLKCGQPDNPHKCKVKCHEGDCPVCDLTTEVKCRCGNMDREIACKDLTSKADDARCEKRCTKKRSCGKHKCNQLCCIEVEHICPLICSKTLSCGRHKCEQSCHKGRCQPCWRSSFDELFCECGASVIYPPVSCGTRRPTCDRPCSRQHSCGHEVLHNCHSEPTCPPCTVLTQRWCHGKHELRKAVPCYVSEISCGLSCNKPISCRRHKCITICHSGACEKPGQQCSQPCTIPRELCGHICAAPCHEDKCPDISCKEMVKVTCQCGHRTMTRVCAENSKEYQRIASSILASKMADMQLGHSVNLEQVFGQGAKKQNQLKTLECNDECKIIERNRRLALGLQIANPDLSGKLMPRYSDFMKQWAKKDSHFCQMVHDKLTELVQLAKTSKQKSRSYSFDCMNKDKRHFIHDLCEHFGCESQAYDQEPKRNVVATAVKDKCWLPSYSLLEIVQRKNGQRKVPGPMLNTSKTDGSTKTILSLPTRKTQKSDILLNIKTPEPEIDYFDYQG